MHNNKIHFIVKVGVFSAIAFLLQMLGSMMAIKVAGFLEIEFSDLPAIIIALSMGPWAGAAVELIKNLLHSTMTSTGFVGEFANLVVNGTFMLVCGYIYRLIRTKRGAVISLLSATIVMALASFFINLYIMLPLYMPDAELSFKLNLAAFTIVPFNLVRGLALSLITMLIYKKISPILK